LNQLSCLYAIASSLLDKQILQLLLKLLGFVAINNFYEIYVRYVYHNIEWTFIIIIIIILLKAILILFNIIFRKSLLHEFEKELSVIFLKDSCDNI